MDLVRFVGTNETGTLLSRVAAFTGILSKFDDGTGTLSIGF